MRVLRPLMRESVEPGGGFIRTRPDGTRWVYDRAGLPCQRCGTRIRARGQGDDNRTTYWCPGCQA